jgi:hypothetical protein
MIRRGFWLTVGAAGGIIGYRRVSALSRQVSQTLGLRASGQERPGQPGSSRRKRHWARETLRFTRDVREGMDMYIARQQGRPAPTLGPGASQTASQRASKRTSQGASGKSPSYRTDHDKREDH